MRVSCKLNCSVEKQVYTSKSGTLHQYRNSKGCYGQVKTKKILLKSRSKSHKKAYNKQRNKCVSLLRKTKKAYYSNLNVQDAVDNKKFWKTIKSLFSDKSNNFENISLIENGNLLTDDFEIAETFNKYF